MEKHKNLNSNYTFDTFLVGPSNQFAYFAAKSVAEKPGVSYNPFLIYGGKGLGKTHLINAIGNEVVNRNPLSIICSLSAEDFIDNFIVATRYGKLEEFKESFENIEVLLMDDIQFFTGKLYTLKEVFYIFNSLYESQKQIILTSNIWPGEIPEIRYALISRFKKNLIVDIQPPIIRIHTH